MVLNEQLPAFWTEFINWPIRIIEEGEFFKYLLAKHGCKKIFDAAAGDGVDSIVLTQAGFDVTSNDIDPEFRKVALQNAKKEGVELKITDYDWRSIPVEEIISSVAQE